MSMRTAFVVLGVIALLLGGVWALQGAGLVMGSFMSGSPLWLGIGTVLVVVGLVLAVFGMRGPTKSGPA